MNIGKDAIVVMTVALAACAPVPKEQRWGYYLAGASPSYAFAGQRKTAGGVSYDGSEKLSAAIDASVDAVEACLKKPIDRASFGVIVAPNWIPSCDGSGQVLPFIAPSTGCQAKGLTPTAECPCRYRAIVQYPNLVVATPNLLLFKDALLRFLTGTENPWADPALAPCASP